MSKRLIPIPLSLALLLPALANARPDEKAEINLRLELIETQGMLNLKQVELKTLLAGLDPATVEKTKELKDRADLLRAEIAQLTKKRETLESKLRALRGDDPKPGVKPANPPTDEPVKKADEEQLRRLKEVIAQQEQQLRRQQQEIDTLRAEIAKLRAVIEKQPRVQDDKKAERIRLQTELATIQQRADEVRKRVTEITNALDKAQTAEDKDRLRAELRELQAALEQLTQSKLRLEALIKEAPDAPRRGGVNPPPDNVEGKVTKTDGMLLLLDVGSDAGLKTGHTLEVFRLDPRPQYLGTLEIVEVKPKECVARPMKKMLGEVKIGDRVASRIVKEK